ncbi:DUF6884 domain-containing protein [Streptomyces sp. NPDC006510]|uniref:DUF6884 domain-containing protein n=1 Tax=Streptomyces sp. NPDC006510 TaxID=3155600 RepID=UPI0033A5CD38
MLIADRHRCLPRVGDADNSTGSTLDEIQDGTCVEGRRHASSNALVMSELLPSTRTRGPVIRGPVYGIPSPGAQVSWNPRAFACGSKKKPIPEGQLHGWPAGELCTGKYHRSLRLAAEALTAPDLILIASALHGLVLLDRPLHPYDVTLGDERAITAERMGGHTAGYGLFDADVIFFGGQEYAELLRTSVPHLLASLTGGMGEQRHLCKLTRLGADFRAALWKEAAARHEEHSAR